MIIKTFTIGGFQVNNYLVICEKTNQAALIDAGGDYRKTTETAKKNNAEIKYVLHTHGHLDHVAGDYDLRKKDGIKIFLHEADKFLVESFQSHSAMFGMPGYETPVVDGKVEDGEEITLGTLKFKVIHTPGHSPGGVCYLIEGVLFSGDTLFADSVGRTDLPGASYEELENSIKNKLFTLDENITVYPGHGPSTTIGHEKENNPFFGARAKV